MIRVKGTKISEEQKRKISDALKGKNAGFYGKHGADHPMSTAIQQLSTDGKTIVAQFASQLEAQRETGIRASNISACINGARPLAGGFKWVKVSDKVA